MIKANLVGKTKSDWLLSSVQKIIIWNIFPIYTFFLAGNIIVYMPSQSTNSEKYFRDYNIKAEVPTPAGNKHFSIHFFPHRTRPLHLSTENGWT